MKKVRKVSPSKIQYDQTHPLICFRTTTEKKVRIEAMAETLGKTISEIETDMLLKGCIDFENAYDRGYDFGFQEGERFGRDEGKEEWGIKIPCNKCDKDDIFLIPNSEWHKLILRLFKSYKFGHKACYEKK